MQPCPGPAFGFSGVVSPSPGFLFPATPQLASASFSVTSNRIHVALQLPVSSWANVTFEDIHGPWMQYSVHVRRASDVYQVRLWQGGKHCLGGAGTLPCCMLVTAPWRWPLAGLRTPCQGSPLSLLRPSSPHPEAAAALAGYRPLATPDALCCALHSLCMTAPAWSLTSRPCCGVSSTVSVWNLA